MDGIEDCLLLGSDDGTVLGLALGGNDGMTL